MSKRGSATMPTAKKSVCVTLEVNPRNALHADDEGRKRGIYPRLCEHNTVLEVQNKGTSVPTKITNVLQKLKKEIKEILLSHVNGILS